MEKKRLADEKEEEEKKAKEQKLKETFGDANTQWEKDKKEMKDLASQQRVAGDAPSLQQGAAAKAAGAAADAKGDKVAS